MKDKNRIFWEFPIIIKNSGHPTNFGKIITTLYLLGYENLDYITFVSEDGKETDTVFPKNISDDMDLVSILLDKYEEYEGGSIRIVKGDD